jgi:two-component system, chemotaxis family, protein-glutamate methylesterase/glutaminase
MRSLLRSVVGTDPCIEVAATASDGSAALRLLDSVAPDIVLLDVEMPVMDGLSTLKALKARNRRLPVIMCSALTQRGGKVTIEALASGASDCVCKPSGAPSREVAVRTLAHDLIPKILALTASRAPFAAAHPLPAQSSAIAAFSSHSATALSPRTLFPDRLPHLAASFPVPNTPPAILLIGVSTGGPAALDLLLPVLPATFPLPILIVQHMPELFTSLLAERLNERCPLAVSEAVHGQPVRPGNIYIARGNWHMEVTGSFSESPGFASPGFAPTLRLTQDPPENHCRPAVDVLFRSAVSIYDGRILGVVLTGMGYDGLAGSRLIRQHGGTVLAQDEATSAVWGMPGAVANAGLAQSILPIQAIAAEILRLVGRSQHESAASREPALRESAV